MGDEKPVVKLTERDKNAFDILAACLRSGREAGWSKWELDEFTSEATSGNYAHLWETVRERFTVEGRTALGAASS